MSVQLLPEPVAAATPVVFERPVNERRDTRPVETSDKANSGSSQKKQGNPTGLAAGTQARKAEPSARPPGTDPSLPPQAIMDASLISADFKPLTKEADIAALMQSNQTNNTQPDSKTATNTHAVKSSDSSKNHSNNSSVPTTAHSAQTSGTDGSAPQANRQIDSQKLAAYSRGSGGSPLSLPSVANPDWLTAIEKTA